MAWLRTIIDPGSVGEGTLEDKGVIGWEEIVVDRGIAETGLVYLSNTNTIMISYVCFTQHSNSMRLG